MSLKCIRYFRLLQLMPQRTRNKHGPFQSTVNERKKKSSSAEKSKDSDPRSKFLLPEIPARVSSVAVSKHVGTKKPSTSPSASANDKNQASRNGKRKNEVKKSYSDTLVARFSGLNLSGTSARKPSTAFSNSRRFLSSVHVSGIKGIAEMISNEKCKNVIVMAGAGISTPSGIPDFRSPGTGLYDNLAEYNLPDPSAIFDIHYFNYNPKPFFRLAKELYPGNYPPNFVHYFIRFLHEKKLLLKMFTQNIDALERAAGIPESKLVEAHGSFATATCRKCKTHYNGSDILDDVMNQEVPKCREDGCKGIIKPDIVFFGEDLPKKFFEYPKHFTKCDLLIVLGTSLEVYPFAGLVDEVSRSTPRILINRDIVGPFVRRKKRPNDVVVKGDIVESVRHLVQLLGWTESIEFLMKKEGFDTAIPRSRNPEVDGEIVIHGKEDEGETGKKL